MAEYETIDVVGVLPVEEAPSGEILYLMGVRAKEPEKGKWVFPTEKRERIERAMEEPEDAVCRCMMEELGVYVRDITPLYDLSWRNGGQLYQGPVYSCRICSGVPSVVDRTEFFELGWFTLEQMHGLDVSGYTARAIEALRGK